MNEIVNVEVLKMLSQLHDEYELKLSKSIDTAFGHLDNASNISDRYMIYDNQIDDEVDDRVTSSMTTASDAMALAEVDMKSAFTNICKQVFRGSELSSKLEIMEKSGMKLERNILLTNTLISWSKGSEFINRGESNYLNMLNSYCKLITLGYIFNNYNVVGVLEYKKDGAVILYNEMTVVSIEFNRLLGSIFEIGEGFVGELFTENRIDKYIRLPHVKTSIFLNRDGKSGGYSAIYKGQLKTLPPALKDLIIDPLLSGSTISDVLSNSSYKEYMDKSLTANHNSDIHVRFTRLFTNACYEYWSDGAIQIFEDWYCFGNTIFKSHNKLKVVSDIDKYFLSNRTSFNPYFVLTGFVYPFAQLLIN